MKAHSQVVLLALMVLTAGCHPAQTLPASHSRPPVLASVTHYLGTPLSGANVNPPPAALAPGDAWEVEVKIVSLDRMPGGGEALGGKTTLVTATRGASAVLPSSRLARGARIASLPDPPAFARVFGGAGQTTILLTARGAVPAGATASFRAAEELPRDDRATGRIWRRGVEVDVFRAAWPATANGAAPAAPIQVALGVDDFIQPDRVDSLADRVAPAAAPGSSAVETPSPQHELAVVDLPAAPNRQTLAITVPFRFERWNGRAVAAIITVGPGTSDPAHVQAVAKCLADLRVSSAIASARPRPGPAGGTGDEGSALRIAMAALNTPVRRRSALIYLAGATGANLCADATLVADDATLARIAGGVCNSAAADTLDDAAIGWLLDQTWFLDMGELLGASKLSPELSAVLATHAGEVGRHPSSIEEVGKAAHNHADFDSLLLAENMIFLEDASPSARARAFDWFQARGAAPAGYAPLDPPRRRREALERAALGLPSTTSPSAPPQVQLSIEPSTDPTQPATAPATAPTTAPTQPGGTPSQESP